jgi:hypothetical protein
MRLVLAVIVAIVLFLFCWALIASLLTLLAWVVVQTGQASSLFFLIHVLLTWVLSPGVGAALAVFATSSIFKTVAPSAIFLCFVSIFAPLSIIVALLETASLISGELVTHQFVVSLLQIVAIFLGARIGRFFAVASSHTVTRQQSVP